jgi:dihydrofolate reductase
MAGINSTVTRSGVDFHIQTQDKGKMAHYVESTVYKSGRVLSSRKTFYTAILDSPELKEQINQIIKEQHNTILSEIEEGKFDHL